jgi:hypothetical protein
VAQHYPVGESFLHYIWQFQYFQKVALKTTAGETLNIIKPGILNSDAGPDFAQAKIKIDSIDWVGNAEIHVKASEWYDHKHDRDSAYENVVLHIVWEDNRPVYRKDGSQIPTLELKDRIDAQLIKSYQTLINSSLTIPCERYFIDVDVLLKHAMIDSALMRRLETKSKLIKERLDYNKGDWEETTYQLLAENFGFKVNKDPFAQVAKSLSYKVLHKHRKQPIQVEALLFGQAGFLVAKTKDEYLTQLYNEYQFLAKKYELSSEQLNVSQWKFLRLRPANFPTIRLAQFASLVSAHQSIFSTLIELSNYKTLVNFFEIHQSAYWQSHYRFGKKSKSTVAGLGQTSVENIIINTIVPLLVAYGQSKDDDSLVDRALNILQAVPSEKNRITRLWQSLGYTSKNAFDSQGLIELYNNFCQKRACMNCVIGSSLLKPNQPLK